MRYFLLLGLLCLLGFASMASGVTNITVTSAHTFDVLSDGNRYLLGTATVGQATTVNLTLTNVSGQAERVTASVVFTDGVTVGGTIVTSGSGIVGGTTVSPGTAAEFAVTGPTKGTISLVSTTQGLEASFSGTGEDLAIGGTMNLVLSVKPLVAGNLTVLINFYQTVTGDDAYFYFTLTAVSPPATPAPVKPKPVKPYVAIKLDAPNVRSDSTGIPAHADWGGDDPVFSPDYAKFVWRIDGRVIAIGLKDPWLWMPTGMSGLLTLEGQNAEGTIVRTSKPQTVYFGPTAVSEPVAYNPSESGYHPKPKPRRTNEASGLRTNEGQGPVAAVDNKRVWPAAPPRAKPTGLKPASWGAVKNSER